jgi:transcriptional regulator with XRE-family HTH domain
MDNENTEILFNELLKSNDIKSFINNNRKHLLSNHMLTFINKIIVEKDLSVSKIVDKSALSTPYAYQILSGKRIPKRDSLIQLAFGLSLTFTETQRLLKLARLGELYTKNQRDSIIIFALNKKLAIYELDEMLLEMGVKGLLDNISS